MKTLVLLGALILSVCPGFSQPSTTTFLPAGYYTAGSYSNGNSSNSYAGYATVAFGGLDYVVAGYDAMTIQSTPWTYDQQFFVVGALKNLYPFYVKLNVGRIEGTFKLAGQRYSYADQTDILNGGFLYNVDVFYVGATYTYMSVSGYTNVRSHQIGLQGDWLLDPAFNLSIRPLYSRVTDGRSLISVGGEVSYAPWKTLVLRVSGMAGKRAYYFNPDFLTVFNQNETQKSLWGIRMEYTIVSGLTVIGSYQSAGFSGYTVRYAAIGARARIPL